MEHTDAEDIEDVEELNKKLWQLIKRQLLSLVSLQSALSNAPIASKNFIVTSPMDIPVYLSKESTQTSCLFMRNAATKTQMSTRLYRRTISSC